MEFIVRGVSQEIAEEVRATRRAPGYGHPAHQELAAGTGPCRCCLRPFVPGVDQRLLFTHRPEAGDAGSLQAPGPVFIHAEPCTPYGQPGFPEELRSLPLALEGRAAGGRVTRVVRRVEAAPESWVEQLFDEGAEWLHLRHADAGCFIAVIERLTHAR